jgi:hypothetical protein
MACIRANNFNFDQFERLDQSGCGLIAAIQGKVKRPYCGRGASGGCWVSLIKGT